MEFLKSHYEKIVLSIVLLGLAAAAALMPMKVSAERQKEEDRKTVLITPKVKEIQPVALTNSAAAISRLEQPGEIKLAGQHNLFNPVRWQRRPDGGLYKAEDAGPNALDVAEIRPLHLRLTFDEVAGTPDNIRYRLSFLNESRSPRATPRIAGVNERNSMFTIEKVIGEVNNPSALEVVLAGEKEPVTITPDKAHERVIGYAADLKYPLENREWKNLKAKDELTFGGETYNIVAITQNEVVLSAKSNRKQTVLKFKPPRQQ